MKEKLKKLLAAYIQHRMLEKQKRLSDPKYRKLEFSKRIAIFSCISMALAFLLSVILSLLDKDPIIEITATVFTVCGGYLCSYCLKSAFEKNSRNKYGLDEFGVPWESNYVSNYCSDESEEEIYG